MKPIFVLSGGPGSGKGTVSSELSKLLGIPTISTGDLLRQEAQTNPELAEKMKIGKLIPDDTVFDLLEKRVALPDCDNGFILDGYPRTLEQAQTLYSKFGNTHEIKVIQLDVSDETILNRILGRKICKNCGQSPSVFADDTVCPNCNCSGTLTRRNDDNPETLKNRLKMFEDNQPSIMKYFRQIGCPCFTVSAENSKEVVFAEICQKLGV